MPSGWLKKLAAWFSKIINEQLQLLNILKIEEDMNETKENKRLFNIGQVVYFVDHGIDWLNVERMRIMAFDGDDDDIVPCYKAKTSYGQERVVSQCQLCSTRAEVEAELREFAANIDLPNEDGAPVNAQTDEEEDPVNAKTDEEGDPINAPSHYKAGGVECIELLRQNLTPEQYKGFLLGNVQKYIFRCQAKGCEEQDLRKAEWYLRLLINGTQDNR